MQSAAPFHTLHGVKETAESRKDAATDGVQALLPHPHPLSGSGEEGEENRVVKRMAASGRRIQCHHRATCSKDCLKL